MGALIHSFEGVACTELEVGTVHMFVVVNHMDDLLHSSGMVHCSVHSRDDMNHGFQIVVYTVHMFAVVGYMEVV